MDRSARILAVAAVLAGVGMVALSASFATGQLDPNTIITPAMTPELNVGKLNYEAYCAKCHGVNTAGTDKGPPFLSRVYHPGHHGDQAFIIAPKQGARAHHWNFGDMKPVEGVTDAQLQTILKYVRAVQKANGLF